MSSNAPGPRPRQVTIGGWVVAVASAMLVVTVFDTMAGLHSVDTRDALTRALTTGAAKDLGISVDDALAIVRAALFVAGTAAAVTGILGIFVLQRHGTARVVLTIAAVPVVLTAPFSGGFLGLVIGASTALLWSQPARDWFAGRPPSRPEASPSGSVPGAGPSRTDERPTVPTPPASGSWAAPGGPPPAPPTPPTTPPTTPASTPPPTYGWGQQPTAPVWGPPQPQAYPHVYPPAYPPGHASPTGVPRQVRVACILTWVFSLLTAALYLLVGLALLADRSAMLDLLRDNPTVHDSDLTDDQLVTVIVAVSAVVVLWCLAACVLAILVWRRHAWAWILLLVSIGVAALVGVVGLPWSLLHLAAAGTALRMLLVAPTRAWFRGDGPVAPAPPGWAPPTGYPQPPQPTPQSRPPQQQQPQPGQPPQGPPSGKPPVW